MDSEHLSRQYWDQVPHAELPEYAIIEKTKADPLHKDRFNEKKAPN
jgi:hypothetical protein